MALPWWTRYPGRLRAELRALRAASFRYQVDRETFRKGRLALTVRLHYEGVEYCLLADYPDNYPYFEPTVCAPDLQFRFHLNPFHKNLCLLGRKTENWWTQWTLARLLQEQFPKIVEANTKPRALTKDLEFDQGEPLSIFYATQPHSLVLVDPNWQIPPNFEGGLLRIGLKYVSSARIFAAVLEVSTWQNQTICSLSEAMARKFETQFWGRWIRVPEFICEDEPSKFDQIVCEKNPQIARPRWGYQKTEPFLDVIGVLFPEEIRRCELADGWIFLRRDGKAPSKRKAMPKPERVGCSLVRAQRCADSELQSRTPESVFSRTKKVAVIGLGCIGAPLALELAKLSMPLLLVDRDEVEFGPSVRWPLGFSYLGWAKSEALRHFIGKQWPYCTVQPYARKFGEDSTNDEQIVQEADVIVDATAELGIQRYLGDMAAGLGKPVIMISTTLGGWGGRLASFLPDRKTSL